MDPFVGEIRAFSFNFPPTDWALCNGQLLAINQNTSLFTILGTTFGGDGKSTFGLPNFSGRTPVGVGAGPGLTKRILGEQFGKQAETLTEAQIPPHSHRVIASTVTTPSVPNMVAAPASNVRLSRAFTLPATTGGSPTSTRNYSSVGTVDTELAPSAIGLTGSDQPHENQQPFLVLNYCIALKGIWPLRQ
ncbi:phage tail protein [Solimonas sp. SE-A11]|uniref:phage tail protein n=1 Tax=Solimonas sp. SE-A11 TaxID=3054954 RepID=UPI00259D0329|nr:tail fiber protein [Solimonas sp. SE-A11]MDM4772594.1 tail fiber protein [Solimonas sp. SE-A11]